MRDLLTRRRLIGSLGAGAGLLVLSGCDKINASPAAQKVLDLGKGLTMRAQRLVTDRTALAPEFSRLDMSPVFRTNGNTMPDSAAYQAHAASRFSDWKLEVNGLVRRPMVRDCYRAHGTSFFIAPMISTARLTTRALI